MVWFLARHPLTPRAIKLLALFIAAYAFSPIDLIPDFIPVLGILDDLIIVPLGVYVVLRLSPPELIEQATMQADELLADGSLKRPQSLIAAAIVVLVWILLVLLSITYLVKVMQ